MRLFEAKALSDPEWAAKKATAALKALLRMWPKPTRTQRDLIKVVASIEELGERLTEANARLETQETQLKRSRGIELDLNARIDDLKSRGAQ